MELLFDGDLRDGILSLISNAKENIILVSPYIILEKSKEYLDKLEEKGKNGIPIRLHTRSEKIENIRNIFSGINNIEIFSQENLHAKLYINESEAIITSLNLIDYSIKNNIEIGFKTETETEYDNIVKDFYYPKLIYNDYKNIFQYRMSWLSRMLNDKKKYFEIHFDEKENRLSVIHDKYTIKVSGYETFNYKVVFKDDNSYKIIKAFPFHREFRKYLQAYIYYIDDEIAMEIFFERDYLFNDAYEAITSDTFYDIFLKLHHIKLTMAHLLYPRK